MDSITIHNGRLSARLIPFGATLVDLRLAGWDRSLVLGYDHIEDYSRTNHYSGAVIGRHANRLSQGLVEIDGVMVQLPRNSGGHHLHGGETGMARQDWTRLDQTPSMVRLGYVSPDGEEGYPGNCAFTAVYEVVGDAKLRLSLEAVSDRTTLVNLCQHPYFNFTGAANIFDHVLEIASETYLPSDVDLIPTGVEQPVRGSPFDFTSPRAVGPLRPNPGYNNNFCLAREPSLDPRFAARLTAPGGPVMEVWTTQAGLHLYDGYKLEPGQNGSDGRVFGPNSGLCLEAQNWPDSPGRLNFPSSILEAGKIYRQITEYRFSNAP
ncbi:MAG: galactose mutarotase [Devosia sp.]|uniref:aldose epimerase family protein n=1 Tax=Devosia sp. TaxID=1871048 RepID=UPI0019FDBE74|nr:aldose epimerase family protein [Devosia sp.]MBF0680724.1 galactose mutarotase [Devosia sp.]